MGLAPSKLWNLLFLAQIAPSRLTCPRIFCTESKCSVSTQTKSKTIAHLLKLQTRVTQICEFPCEPMTVWFKNSTFDYFDRTVWTPRSRSPTPIMAPGRIILVTVDMSSSINLLYRARFSRWLIWSKQSLVRKVAWWGFLSACYRFSTFKKYT